MQEVLREGKKSIRKLNIKETDFFYTELKILTDQYTRTPNSQEYE
jgi:hypothetical protein